MPGPAERQTPLGLSVAVACQTWHRLSTWGQAQQVARRAQRHRGRAQRGEAAVLKAFLGGRAVLGVGTQHPTQEVRHGQRQRLLPTLGQGQEAIGLDPLKVAVRGPGLPGFLAYAGGVMLNKYLR